MSHDLLTSMSNKLNSKTEREILVSYLPHFYVWLQCFLCICHFWLTFVLSNLHAWLGDLQFLSLTSTSNSVSYNLSLLWSKRARTWAVEMQVSYACFSLLLFSLNNSSNFKEYILNLGILLWCLEIYGHGITYFINRCHKFFVSHWLVIISFSCLSKWYSTKNSTNLLNLTGLILFPFCSTH